MEQKQYEELELRDDFMFGKVMSNKVLCKQMLEIMLGMEIQDIEYPERQKPIEITAHGRGVRLDVYVQDENRIVYDSEMQNYDSDQVKELPKRSRYYSGMIDLNLMTRGVSYQELNDSYIIFICTFDPFGLDQYCYTFQNVCLEEPELKLGDGTVRIFLNTKGKKGKISDELKAFLNYVEKQEVTDGFTGSLDQEVRRIRENMEWRREYMKSLLFEQDAMNRGRREGLELGLEQGRRELNRLNKLNLKLIELGRTEDIVRSSSDEEYQKKLLQEFNLE